MQIFRPEELQELVCGSAQLDFHELEKNTHYDGYTKESRVVCDFWSIVHNDLTEEQQKQLLFFATGSDRVPVGGLGNLSFVIAKNGADSDRLPVTHTCYNVLLLNEYSTREKLLDRLLKALENANCGFYMH